NLSVSGFAYSPNNVGGIAMTNYGTIEGSNFTGTVLGISNVGGIVGTNHGIIRYSFSDAQIAGNAHVGGIAGVNNGTIERSYSANIVVGVSSHIGGIAGENHNLIQNAYSTAEISGSSFSYNVGGISGRNRGTVNNVFSTGTISGGRHVAGLVGLNNGTLSNSVAVNHGLNANGVNNPIANGSPAINSFVYGEIFPISPIIRTGSYVYIGEPSLPIYTPPLASISELLMSSWWQDILGWSSTIWNFAAALPTLNGVGGVQNPQIPPSYTISIHLPEQIHTRAVIKYPPYDSEDECYLEDDSDINDESDSENDSDYTDDDSNDSDNPYDPEYTSPENGYCCTDDSTDV
ncbi:MAG: hypothetical protein FWE92_02315, partial [Defluviitaleaceae bacterium]|nr:hypothetical protein [Defluviitaleaceae bacterium]